MAVAAPVAAAVALAAAEAVAAPKASTPPQPPPRWMQPAEVCMKVCSILLVVTFSVVS